MKTVIVFDTDDQEGMKNTLKIMNHLTREYLGTPVDTERYKKSFGKIQFIKMLRSFAKEAEKAETDGGSLRFAKMFADKIWSEGEETL
jgi:hypothetical protein